MKLIYATPISVISDAIRYSHGNMDKSVDATKEENISLIKKVAFGMNHSSTLEVFRFIIILDYKIPKESHLYNMFFDNKYSNTSGLDNANFMVSSNLRVLVDMNLSATDVELLLGVEVASLFNKELKHVKRI